MKTIEDIAREISSLVCDKINGASLTYHFDGAPHLSADIGIVWAENHGTTLGVVCHLEEGFTKYVLCDEFLLEFGQPDFEDVQVVSRWTRL